MKKFLGILLAMVLVLSLGGCGDTPADPQESVAQPAEGASEAVAEQSSPQETPSQDEGGVYSSVVQGFGGEFTVEVELSGEEILRVSVGDNNETDGLGSVAIGQLTQSIVAYQSIAVDTVSGATITSEALLGGVSDCIVQSGADLSQFQAAVDMDAEEDMVLDTDVLIVGAGGAGLSAAIEAYNAGASVIVLEKMPLVGGNTNKATGGMNASETHIQELRGGTYTNDEFYQYTFEGGHEKADPELLRFYVENSAAAVQWLDDLGVNFTWEDGTTVGMLHSVNNGGAFGPELMRVLTKKLDEINIEPMLNTTATELITDDSGQVTGAIAQGKSGNQITVNAKAVVLATGGFGANEDMYVQYRPELKGYVTTNHPGATGDGILMAQAVGADLTDIGEIQIHPTVEQETSSLITESLRTDGAILLNTSGQRFFNECSTRDRVSAAVLEQDQSMAYLLLDQGIRDVRSIVDTYLQQGFMKEFATLADVADYMGVDPEVIEQTVADWNTAVANKEDPDFDSAFSFDRDLSHAPYYVVKIAPGVHHTMGGLKINTNTQVINTDGQPIPGLYAAGEVTGGIHGGNRIGGNAMADIVIFGRAAGTQSAEYANQL